MNTITVHSTAVACRKQACIMTSFSLTMMSSCTLECSYLVDLAKKEALNKTPTTPCIYLSWGTEPILANHINEIRLPDHSTHVHPLSLTLLTQEYLYLHYLN